MSAPSTTPEGKHVEDNSAEGEDEFCFLARQLAWENTKIPLPSASSKCPALETTVSANSVNSVLTEVESDLLAGKLDRANSLFAASQNVDDTQDPSSLGGASPALSSGSSRPEGNTPSADQDISVGFRVGQTTNTPAEKRRKLDCPGPVSEHRSATRSPVPPPARFGPNVRRTAAAAKAEGARVKRGRATYLSRLSGGVSLSPRGHRIAKRKKRKRDHYERMLVNYLKGGRFQSAEDLLRQSVRSSIVDQSSSFLKNPSIENVTDELLTFCLRYLDLDAAFLNSVPLVCKDWHRCANSELCWSGAENSWSASNGSAVNWANYRFIKACESKVPTLQSGAFYTGTEGDCFKAVQRSTGKQLTIKKARVYPGGEGVPYYMLRELSFLEDLRHPHVSRLHRINLKDNHLYCFFDFISCTMYDLINPAKNPTGGKPLSKGVVKMFMHQLISAIAYCHRCGVVHRNLKPKHLLIQLGPDGDVAKARLQVSDFALVRSTCIPLRTYTTEVVTLWYRPPEVLMGDRYFLPVDMWSIGCIFAEMALGRPLFPGICEIDQLFQIFSTLGTPSSDWPEFKSLPNYRFSFPNWKPKDLAKVLPALEPAARNVLSGLLALDPRQRTTAQDALSCSYFDGSNALASNSPAKGEKVSFPPLRGLRALGLVDGEAGIQPCSSFTHTPRRAYQIGGYDLQFLGNYHAYIRSLESSRFPFRDYLPLQNELRQNHRGMLVDWLIEVVDVFEMSLRSAFLAVQYVDRYLGTTVISRSKFQLLGATCLHIASKCEDVSYIGVDDLAVCADNVYHSKHVLSLEENVLNSLEFKLSSSTVLDFLNMYLEHCPYFEDSRVALLSKYLAELSLQEYLVSVSVQPSKIAAACIIRALQCLKKPFWEAWLSAISGYRWSSLRECVTAICDMHARSFNKDNTLLVIRKRYLKDSRLSVANIKSMDYPCFAE